jgi:hypothetical protein
MKNTLRIPAAQAALNRRNTAHAVPASGGVSHRELPERQADVLHGHHRDAPVRCPVCDKRVQRRARQQTYCSRKCRQRAHYDKSVAEGRFDPTNPPQKFRNFSELQATKTGSSLRIYGPAGVIERELFAGRDWCEATSTDGVVCLVASLSRTPTRSGGVP